MSHSGQKAVKKVLLKDDTPIKNIYIPNLLKRNMGEPILRYFEKYGNVKNVIYAYSLKRSQPICCTIFFEDASSACAALAQSNHTIGNENLKVLACPNWEQSSKNAEVIQESKFTSLNDYCLEAVYQLLDLHAQVCLSLSNHRLENIFEHMVSPRRVNLDFIDLKKLSLLEVHYYLRLGGRFIRTIVVESRMWPAVDEVPDKKIFDFIHDYCPDVSCLRILGRPTFYKSFLGALNPLNITDLELYECDLSDGDLLCLQDLCNLRSLGLGRNPQLRCVTMPPFCQLERLSLYDCTKLTAIALIKICKESNLHYLDLRGAGGYITNKLLVKHCKSLQTLRISGIDLHKMDILDQLPKLKSLEVAAFVFVRPINFFNALADKLGNMLTELKLCVQVYFFFARVNNTRERFANLRVLWLYYKKLLFEPKDFINFFGNLSQLEELNFNNVKYIHRESLLPVLDRCGKLKRLGLRNNENIDNEFVLDAITILSNRAIKPTKPILMLVYGTSVTRKILKWSKYLAGCELLKLSFHDGTVQKGLLDESTEFVNDKNEGCIEPCNGSYN